ncbi:MULTISPECIES: MFS transporter [unclassified Fusibacter]|uniref:MFS transporter n=1 Tax=unclassified Fusibacter TaxID=2624464 RepID=UPI0010120AD4|nr:MULTISPECIES: MFS transporter [unclassified Fusibacter]MCK8058193.1 MFS transporter [Fusibacter sp. A2]NPE20776.1 MFS transporter [Fusibacter sp. A1]RXV62982.1 MFS transporter [Fusibacter sp. A1]
MFNMFTSLFSQYKGLSRSVYVFFFARLVTTMGAFIWPLLTLILSRKMGYSASTIALVSIGVGVLFLPAQILGGKLADKFDKKKIIIIFDLISVTFFMTCAFIEPGNLMVILFILAGLFANMEGPAFEALIAESTKPAEREKVYSLNYLGHNLGYMFGAAVGGLLFENFLNLAFIFDGLTTITSTLMIIMLVKVIDVQALEEHEKNEYEDSEEHDVKPWAILKERKSIMVMLSIFFFSAFVYNQWGFALPLYLSSLFDTEGASLFGFISSFNGFLVVLLTPILTRVLDKYTEIPKIVLGIGLYSLSFLILINSNAVFIFYVMITLFTIGEIVTTLGGSPFISRRIPASHRGRVSSIIGICYMLGATLGQLVTAYLIDNVSFNAAFALLTLVGLTATVIAGINYRIDKKQFPKLYMKDKKTELQMEASS